MLLTFFFKKHPCSYLCMEIPLDQPQYTEKTVINHIAPFKVNNATFLFTQVI